MYNCDAIGRDVYVDGDDFTVDVDVRVDWAALASMLIMKLLSLILLLTVMVLALMLTRSYSSHLIPSAGCRMLMYRFSSFLQLWTRTTRWVLSRMMEGTVLIHGG